MQNWVIMLIINMLRLFYACFDKNIYFVDSLLVFYDKSEYAFSVKIIIFFRKNCQHISQRADSN